MLLKVGDLTFGWGADVRALPENSHAYGPKVLTEEQELALAAALKKARWKPSWRTNPQERVVFLTDPKAKEWRQSVTTKAMRGQTLEVVEVPDEEAPKKAAKK